jgi:mRNA export factor
MASTSTSANTAAADFEVSSLQRNFLIAGCWDTSVRCWELLQSGQTNPVSMRLAGGYVLDVCWQDDGSKVYMATTEKQVKCWDLASGAVVQVAQHNAPIKTCHWIKGPNYTCLMTGSWDKTLKFWDTRTPTPLLSIALPERCNCAAVDYPMAVVDTADKRVIVYSLENKPTELRRHGNPLKFQHRAVAIFKDKEKKPTGYALGSIEGRVAVQYLNPTTPSDNFTFKCHRSIENLGYQNVYAVNDVAVHPVHGTLATVGSDGMYSFWDKDARRKLKMLDNMEQSITKCEINSDGQIFAYAVCYDWTKVSEK